MSRDIVIRAMTPADAGIWESLRRDLWPDGAEDHGPEIAQFFAGQHFDDLTAAFIAEDQNGAALGYAELVSEKTWKVWLASEPDMSKDCTSCRSFATVVSRWSCFSFQGAGHVSKAAWRSRATGRDVP